MCTKTIAIASEITENEYIFFCNQPSIASTNDESVCQSANDLYGLNSSKKITGRKAQIIDSIS